MRLLLSDHSLILVLFLCEKLCHLISRKLVNYLLCNFFVTFLAIGTRKLEIYVTQINICMYIRIIRHKNISPNQACQTTRFDTTLRHLPSTCVPHAIHTRICIENIAYFVIMPRRYHNEVAYDNNISNVGM